MVDRLVDYFLGEPRRLVALGAALVRVAGFLLLAGVVGKAATTAVSAVKSLGGATRVDALLADVFPDYLSFWMPESVLGFGFALLLLAVGVAAARTGRTYQRYIGT